MKLIYLFFGCFLAGCTAQMPASAPEEKKEIAPIIENFYNLRFARDPKRGVICYRFQDHEGMFCFVESKLNQGETK